MMSKRTLIRRQCVALLLLAVLVFATLNACVILASRRWNLSLDWTGQRLYALSPLTQEVLLALASPTEVQVLSTEAEYPAVLRELLGRAQKMAPHLTVRFTDPYANPMLINHYQERGMALKQGDLLVEGAQRAKAVSYESLLLYDGERLVGIDLEQQLCAALLYVNSTQMPAAAFTVGHNERPTTALKKVFEDNNFTLGNLSLQVGADIAQQVVVIAAPTQDFAPGEIDALAAYMAQGGKVMVFLEPGVSGLTNLEALLAARGIATQPGVVLEEKAFAANNPLNIIAMYASHEANAYFAEHAAYVVMPSAMPLALVDRAAQGIRASALLYSTPDAYAKRDLRYQSTARAAQDDKGPFVLAAIAEQSVPGGKAQLFAAGSRMLYADDLMGTTSYANRMFLTKMLGYLWQDTTMLSIPPKTMTTAQLAITQQQILLAGVLSVGVVPLIILGMGVLVKLRRKRL